MICLHLVQESDICGGDRRVKLCGGKRLGGAIVAWWRTRNMAANNSSPLGGMGGQVQDRGCHAR